VRWGYCFYNNLVLHVVVEDDGAPCLRADGRPVPVLVLGAWVAAPLATAAAGSAASPPCQVSPALQTRDVHAIVRAAGRTRLEAKAAALEAQIAVLGAEQALFTALLDAAGYSRNRGPCGQLAERLPVERLQHLLAGKTPERATTIATATGKPEGSALARSGRAPPCPTTSVTRGRAGTRSYTWPWRRYRSSWACSYQCCCWLCFTGCHRAHTTIVAVAAVGVPGLCPARAVSCA
jgi:Protein of unknown function (DUF2851)